MTDEVIAPRALDILPRYEPALSSTSDQPNSSTPPAPAAEAGPALSVGPAGENAHVVTAPADPEAVTDPVANADDVAAEAEAVQAGEPKPPQKFSERVAQLAADRRAAEERAAAAEARALAAEQAQAEKIARLTERVEKLVAQTATPDPADIRPVRPQRTNFDDPAIYDAAVAAYEDGLVEWAGRQSAKTAEAKMAERALAEAETAKANAITEQAAAAAKRVVDTFNAAQVKAAQAHPDFAQVVNDPNVKISTPMAHALMMSEDGAEVAYWLAKNPADAERIFAATPEPTTPWEAQAAVARAAIEIGKISAKIAQPRVEVSRAPNPVAPVGTRAASGKKSLDEMSMDEYAATVPEYVARRTAEDVVKGKRAPGATAH